MVKKNCAILNVDAGVDYRLRVLKQAQLFKSPLSNEAQNWMSERFSALTHTQAHSQEPIVINNRVVETLGHTEDVLWCEFSELSAGGLFSRRDSRQNTAGRHGVRGFVSRSGRGDE